MEEKSQKVETLSFPLLHILYGWIQLKAFWEIARLGVHKLGRFQLKIGQVKGIMYCRELKNCY